MQKPRKISVQALKSPIITEGQDLFSVIVEAMKAVRPSEGHILAITSKVVAVTQGRVARPANFNKLVQREADLVLGGSPVTLTLKNGIFTPWAGIDRSNTKPGTAVLWPAEPDRVAHQLQQQLRKKFRLKHFGVLIVDSFCAPLRRGVIGIALGHAGFEGVNDQRGKLDLYGNKLQFTQEAIADSLATMANLAMGQGSEQTPFALISGAPVKWLAKPDSLLMPAADCLYAPLYNQMAHKSQKKH